MEDVKQTKVQILDETTANQIAAGEVVERPAAAVKELVENALDAGARRVLVELEEGGKYLLRVTDDGSGMSREDAILSLQRHERPRGSPRRPEPRPTLAGSAAGPVGEFAVLGGRRHRLRFLPDGTLDSLADGRAASRVPIARRTRCAAASAGRHGQHQ